MNCYFHPDQLAVAYCRTCGKPLCQMCQRTAEGTIFCPEHVPLSGTVAAPAKAERRDDSVSPGLAFILGLIPGVGAVYNRQYVKGLVHVVILGVLISITASDAAEGLRPLFGLLIALWFFYMPFEAYHTASARRRGESRDEFSSLLAAGSGICTSTAGPVALILLGVVFLLNTLGWLPMHVILRWWPVSLIAIGAYMLYCRIRVRFAQGQTSTKVQNDEQS